MTRSSEKWKSLLVEEKEKSKLGREAGEEKGGKE